MTGSTNPARDTLRTGLLAQREEFMSGSLADAAERSLIHHLQTVLTALEPHVLGMYWPQRSEFNAVAALRADTAFAKLPMALPFSERNPIRLQYRRWDGAPPTIVDDWGIPTSDGPAVVPDVVLVPCVGFTEDSFRLGYGGGYFDRWLAAHAHVTAIGVAWSGNMIDSSAFAAQPHDKPLALIVTEHGVVS